MLNQNKSNVDAFLLCSLTGIFGFHRFYVGKYFSGTLQLLSLGGFLIWALVDWVAIIREEFSDYEGNLLSWEENRAGEYAGFRVRFAAHIIDHVIVSITSFILFQSQELEELIKVILSIFYITILTASKMRATIGKKIVGVIVVDKAKNPLSLSHSFARCLAYYFSYLTLVIGFLMIAWTKKHTGLHDKIAQTYVIYK